MDNRFSKLGQASIEGEQPFFNAWAGLLRGLTAVSQSSKKLSFAADRHLSALGGPGTLSSGPADGRKQVEFTSAVKRSRRRASPASVQRVRS